MSTAQTPAKTGGVLAATCLCAQLRLAARFGGLSVVGAGFAITAGGFAVIGITRPPTQRPRFPTR